MGEYRVCGRCLWHNFDGDWGCGCPDSERYGDWTGWNETCEDWEAKGT